MKILDLHLAEGGRIPRGFGIAWTCPNQLAYVVLPIPFHWIAGFVRRAWHEFLLGYRGEASLKDAAYLEGYKVGERVAQENAWRAGRDYGEERAMLIIRGVVKHLRED